MMDSQFDSDPGLKVLIVDDNAVTRRGLGLLLMLEPEIGQVHEAASGGQAEALVRDGRFDIVMIDLRMPGLAPVEAIRHIKTSAPAVRVVAMSMVADSKEAALAGGADLFIEKVDLLSGIRRVLPSDARGLGSEAGCGEDVSLA